LLRKNKEKKSKLPTAEEFLQYRPTRLDFKWSTNADGIVVLDVPKFKGKIGISLCKVIRKDNTFTANLDKLGSLVWKNCDGKQNVKQILEKIQKEFPNEENIDQRLFLFLQQMMGLNYIDFF
jgi:hypothetical protein